MSNLDLRVIRAALARQLRTIEGLYVYEYWTDTPAIFPCAVIRFPNEIEYSITLNRGADSADIQLFILTNRVSESSQRLIEDYLSGTGDRSIITCLYANRRLIFDEDGPIVAQLRVLGARVGPIPLQAGSTEAFGTEIEIHVKA